MLDPERILRLESDRVVFLDQRSLPLVEVEVECRTAAEVAEAITTMVVRGAPAIGVAAAYGYALASRSGEDPAAAEDVLRRSRPTAVNLGWALDRMLEDPSADNARRLHADEVDRCRQMAAHAAELFAPGTRALTHCNAGGLATGGYGSAVGALLTAWERGLLARVWVDETRPLLQGARLTAWELETAAIPHTVIADSAAASLMAAGEVDLVVTGADRIAANGDTANKIGTYSLAVLARYHEIPFYVVAPTSTVDLATPTGAGIPIEERDPAEITVALPGAQPGLRRDAGRARQRDRHRAGRPSRPVRALARRGAGRDEGDHSRRGLRDPAPSAHRRRPEAAPARRRTPDPRLDPGEHPAGRRDRRDPRRHEQPLRRPSSGRGRRRTASSSTTTARAPTRTGSGRSAT